MNESELQSAGELLRDCRLKKGVSLKDVAEKTKIRLTYLQALEEDRHEGVPEGAYRSGFMRIYAEFLGLPPQMVLERYRQQSTDDGPEPVPCPDPDPTVSRRRKPALLLAVILLLLLVGGGVVLFFRPMASGPPQTAVEKPKAANSPGPSLAWNSPTETAESQALPASPPRAQSLLRDLPEQSAPESVFQSDAVVNGATTVDSAPAAQVISRPPVSEIRLETVAAVGFAISVDGRPPREYNVPANVVLKWKTRQGVRLETEDPSALRVWMDNRLIEAVQWPLVLPRTATSTTR